MNNTIMQRVSVHVSGATRQQIKLLAGREQVHESVMIRELLQDGLAARKRRGAGQPHGLLQLAELRLKGGPSDLAQHHDDYLYGHKA